jgi:cyclic lactone autoinducer peptide
MKNFWTLLGVIAIKVASVSSRFTAPGYAYEPKLRNEIEV